MTTQIDFRTLPANVPVMCIPRVYPNITESRIRKIFDDLDMGALERIDIVSKVSEKGEKFNRVFVHMRRWNLTSNACLARERLLNGKEIKIIYDDPWFWKVSAYREAEKKPAAPQHDRSRATIDFDSDDSPRYPPSKPAPRHHDDRSARRDDRPRHHDDRPARRDDRPRHHDDRPRHHDDRPRHHDDRPPRRDDRPRNRKQRDESPERPMKVNIGLGQTVTLPPRSPSSSPPRERQSHTKDFDQPEEFPLKVDYGKVPIPKKRNLGIKKPAVQQTEAKPLLIEEEREDGEVIEEN
jgi:hypothetical protein